PYKPFEWDLPGGDLEFGEDPQIGILREIKEEAGLEVKNLQPFSVRAHVNKVSQFWVTVCYKAEAVNENVAISWEHDQFEWVTADEFLKRDASDKQKKFIEDLKKL
ncbi:NUDIX hydrolase, partial [Candidatus Uhrbacteria bacterium]|nr:NUDIX hydrolase [Candidatus Uhrbacteria bacterium]